MSNLDVRHTRINGKVDEKLESKADAQTFWFLLPTDPHMLSEQTFMTFDESIRKRK